MGAHLVDVPIFQRCSPVPRAAMFPEALGGKQNSHEHRAITEKSDAIDSLERKISRQPGFSVEIFQLPTTQQSPAEDRKKPRFPFKLPSRVMSPKVGFLEDGRNITRMGR